MDPLRSLETENFMKTYLVPGDYVIDVGSNIGTTTLSAALSVGAEGKVFSFEPNPRIFMYQKENISLNNLRNVEIHNLAIGNESGKIYLMDISSDVLNQVAMEIGENVIEVPIKTLDQLKFNSNKKIALLKVDVEGYEKFVFEGAQRLLENVQCIYFEAWCKHFEKFEYSLDEIRNILAGKHFKVYKFKNSSSQITPLPTIYQPKKCENLIAIKNLEDFLSRTSMRLVYE